ncbi:MAG: PilZ domain-containing protein [Deltaproteobacteria bacterium]|jgi:Tfp pilus assembly protein PilZ
MDTNPEKRNNARIDHRSPITVENIKAGVMHRARMMNFSANGLYFEADNLLQPGEEIFVGIDDSPFASAKDTYECYRVRIVWRKKLKKSAFYYGYGAKRTLDRRQVKLQKGDAIQWKDIRKHQRKPYSKSIRFAAKDSIFEGFLKNISSAGVFIETHENFSAGQTLTLEIPLKKNQKAKVKGEVVWSSPDGFGVKFLSVDKQEPAADKIQH